jgi:hypothetical protein
MEESDLLFLVHDRPNLVTRTGAITLCMVNCVAQ